MHSLKKKVIRLNFFETYAAWKRYFHETEIEWFPTIRQHIKVQETVISEKQAPLIKNNLFWEGCGFKT